MDKSPKTDQADHTPKPTSWDNLHQPDPETINDILKLSPVEQLSYLSNTWEQAEADTTYAVTTGKQLFDTIKNDTKFTPFIRLIAEAAQTSDPNYPDEGQSYEPPLINKKFGYSSLVSPDTLPHLDDPEISSLSETEIETRLNQLKNEDAPIPKQYYDYFSYEAELELALSHIYYSKNQEKLHQEFPSLPNTGQLLKIAPDAAISIQFQEKYDFDISWFSHSGSLNALSDNQDHTISMAEMKDNAPNSFGLNKDLLTYLEAIHCNPRVKNTVETTLGLNLTDIPLDSQIQLLKFMTEADSSRYENLRTTLQNTPTILRQKLAEAFLATDFGPDFGDSLLTIANSDHFTPDQAADILISIDSCRSSIKNISSLYSSIDNGAFSEQYSRAANERLTDAITVFREIAEHGKVSADLDWAGQTNFTYDSAIEALNYEVKSLSIISGTMDDVISGKDSTFAEQILSPDDDRQRSLYNFYSPAHGYVLLYTRPEGSSSFDPTLEYGKFRSRFSEHANNAGVEASISFIVNPVDPFSLPNPYRPDHQKSRNPNYYDHSTMDKVSAIRLDREGRAPDAPPTDEDRSPITKIGTISVDLAAIGDRPDTPSGKIARLLSTGNRLREQSQGTDFSLNHNTRHFDQSSYGTSDGFKSLVSYIQSNADILCLISPPDKKSPSFSSAAHATRQPRRRSPNRQNLRPAA